MAQGMELLDNGTKVFTGPGAAFGTDALLLDRFAMPRRKETALDLCSGCGIVALAWHDAGHRGPCTAVELDADASALCRRAVQETPGAEHITALCTDLRTFCKSGPEQGKYDFAACNPPYFTGGYVSPDAGCCRLCGPCPARWRQAGPMPPPGTDGGGVCRALRRWAGAQAGGSGAQG